MKIKDCQKSNDHERGWKNTVRSGFPILNFWQFLKDNELTDGGNNKYELTKAGLLLFGKNPSVALTSKCGIKISHYYGTKLTFPVLFPPEADPPWAEMPMGPP